MKYKQIQFAVPDISRDPVVCPRLTPRYRSLALKAFIITPCAKALNGATETAINRQEIRAKFKSWERIAIINNMQAIIVNIKLHLTTIFLPKRSAKSPEIGIAMPNPITIITEKALIMLLLLGMTSGKYCFMKITVTW